MNKPYLKSTPEELTSEKLNHLDLAMEQSRYIASGADIPTNLKNSLKAKSEVLGRPGILLYEDLVITNPLDENPRNFLQGDDVSQEIFFYKVHNHIEKYVSESIAVVEQLLSLEQSEYSGELAYNALISALEAMAKVIIYMQTVLHDLSPEIFSRLRPFFVNPEPYPGPSGKYSPALFCFDALCLGNDPIMLHIQNAKMKEIDFFPSTSLELEGLCGQADMKRIFSNYCSSKPLSNKDLKSVISSFGDNKAKKMLKDVLSLIQQFRGVHTSVILKFIPEAKESSGKGTAGDNIQKHIMMVRDAYRKLCNVT